MGLEFYLTSMKLQVRLLKKTCDVSLVDKWLNCCWILSKSTEEVPVKVLLEYRMTEILIEMNDEER